MQAVDLEIREAFLSLTAEQKRLFVESLSDDEAQAILYDWTLWARPKQLEPEGDWAIWYILAGRGFGKTRTGAETCIAWAKKYPGIMIHLVAATAADARDTMVEGESGIIACSPPWFMPEYEPSKRRVTWPNGTQARLFSAEEPDRLRGPSCHRFWADEREAWAESRREDTWDQLMMGWRLTGTKGQGGKGLATSTPRPSKDLKTMLARPDVHVTTGTTWENEENLDPRFKETLLSRYAGTRLGLQELEAKVLEDNPSALWSQELLERLRRQAHPDLTRIVVAVDPATTYGEKSDSTGIIVAGIGECDCKGEPEEHAFVLADLTMKAKPNEWAEAVVEAYHQWLADKIVAETNQGGEMVRHTIQVVDDTVNIEMIHAKKGKVTRAEPIAGLYEQGRVHHVGVHEQLEDELCLFEPNMKKSPDRGDGLVYALTELMLGGKAYTEPRAYFL